MFKSTDPYAFSKLCQLYVATQKDPVGTLLCEYQVTRYENVQARDATAVDQAPVRRFWVHASHRVNLWNEGAMSLAPDPQLYSYDNYPVMLNAAISPQPSDAIVCELRDYSPKTVNTKVQAAQVGGTSSGQTSSYTSSSTVGSSTAETNSYGASVSTESASVNYEHSTTTTEEQSQTKGSESGRSATQDASNSATMSVKDWGAYALLNPATDDVGWVFGQEYPWDAIENRKTQGKQNPKNPSQVDIVVPTAAQVRLFDGVSLYPPSQLSQFGVSFVMKALWQVDLVDGASDVLTLAHRIDYFTGSHSVPPTAGPNDDPSPVVVFMDLTPATLSVGENDSLSTDLDLTIMALDPAGKHGKVPVIGFLPRKFIVAPAPMSSSAAATPFKIASTANNLLVKDTTSYPAPAAGTDGAGFTAAETMLTATLTAACPSLQMTLYFKVTDVEEDHTLVMKHWKGDGPGLKLTLVVNDDTANPITRYVDAAEGEGGDNNLTEVILRNQDFATSDYQDLLQLGLNSIQITIAALESTSAEADAGGAALYHIRALSIES